MVNLESLPQFRPDWNYFKCVGQGDYARVFRVTSDLAAKVIKHSVPDTCGEEEVISLQDKYDLLVHERKIGLILNYLGVLVPVPRGIFRVSLFNFFKPFTWRNSSIDLGLILDYIEGEPLTDNSSDYGRHISEFNQEIREIQRLAFFNGILPQDTTNPRNFILRSDGRLITLDFGLWYFDEGAENYWNKKMSLENLTV